MLPPRCLTCGRVLAHIQEPYEKKLEAINKNSKLTEDEKSVKKQELNKTTY